MVRAGGSASRTSNNCDPTVLAGVGSVLTLQGLLVAPRLFHHWEASRRYIRQHRVVRTKIFRIVPRRDWSPPVAPASGTRRAGRHMRPAGRQNRSPKSLGRKTVVANGNVVTDDRMDKLVEINSSSDMPSAAGTLTTHPC